MRKCSINHTIVYSILFSIALLPAVSNALDITYEPRLQAGIIDYTFEQKSVVDASNKEFEVRDHGFKLVTTMPFVGVGTTLFADKFFLDFYVQKAFSGSDMATNSIDFIGQEGSGRLDVIMDAKLERDEYSVSMGYALGRQWALFGGYRKSKTSFSHNLTFDVRTGTGSGKRDADFNQDGFFLGGVYALPVGEYSGLSFTAALANFNGKYDSRGNLVFGETYYPTGILFNGDTIGLNLGATWRGRILNNLNYTLGIDGYSYNFDAKKVQTFTDGLSSVAADLSESVLRFSAGLSYQF
jgi:hypothetical protein